MLLGIKCTVRPVWDKRVIPLGIEPMALNIVMLIQAVGHTLSERRLKALRRAVRQARFATLRGRYAPDGVVSDGITETVRHAGRTVVVETGGDPPARLRRLLARLAGLV